jgi:uncharacterized membrane protein
LAGIGFKLKNMQKDATIFSIVKSYGYAAMLSSGPWISSIIAILIIGFLKNSLMDENDQVMAYQLIITYAYAFASSVMLTGFIQLPFTRYIADKIYQQREDLVLPSYFGALLVTIVIGMIFLFPLSLYVFPEQSILFILLVVYIFIVMTGVWLANILTSSLKFYHGIFISYFIIYSLIVIFSYYFGNSMEMIMGIFLTGNVLLFIILTIFIIMNYPSSKLISFGFFKRKNFYWFLGFSGLFYSLAVWIDKFIFWYHPDTGTAILGKLHGSVVYDMPIFMAYLTIVPGMTLFFFRLEAYFSQKYDLFFNAVKKGGTLNMIFNYKNQMVDIIRQALRDILYLQTAISIIIYIYTPQIFSFLHIPLLYSNLFHIDMIGAQLQLGFISILSLLFYLDKRRATMWLSLLFLVLNGILTLLSIKLGPYFFGYGYALSLLIVFIISLWVIKKTLEDIEYETFLLH